MRIKLLACLFMSFAVSAVWADGIVTDEITLRDGTVYEGYISSQIPGRSYTIAASRTVSNVPAEKAKNISVQEFLLEEAPEKWREWAEKNPDKVQIRNDKKYLSLASFDLLKSTSKRDNTVVIADTAELDSIAADSLYFLDKLKALDGVKSVETFVHIKNVLILQEGRTIKYLNLEEQSMSVARNEVVSIKPVAEAENLLSGFKTVLELSSGSVISGKVIETVPGKTIYLKTDRGDIQACNLSEIRRNAKEKKNAQQNYLEQSPLFETAILSDGRAIEGVIVEQRYGNARKSSSIVIVNADGERTVVENSKVKSLNRTPNPNYKPLYKLDIAEGEVFANQERLTAAKCAKEKKHIRITPTQINAISRDADGNIVVQTRQDSKMEQLLFVKLYVTVKEGEAHYLEAEDLLTGAIPATEKNTVSGISNWVFHVVAANYAIYFPTINTAYICNIR